ncbi:MAG: DNA polymerase III subunit delta' [Sphingomonadaceae bacterium]|nr:DNA polymerase III subunit delta' [Sphingomonadaceae bacterium]
MTVIGHAAQGELFRDAVASGKLHHAWLLAGPKGVGKARFAGAAATWLLARAADGRVADDDFAVDPAHPTARLLAAGSHIDFRRVEIQENPKTGKLRPGIAVDQFVKSETTIGEPLNSIFRTRPALSDWRVIVVDAADDMNRNAANAFLKHLEEPPRGTLFLAISHAPSRLLPTIRSRCRTLRFQALGDDEVDAVLARELASLPEAERAALRAVAGGSPGRAVQLAQADVAGLTAALEGLARATSAEAGGQALALARSLSAKAATPRYEALLDLVPAFIAAQARSLTGARLAHAIRLWEQASALAASALPLSLDPQATAFQLAEFVAALSRTAQVHEIA